MFQNQIINSIAIVAIFFLASYVITFVLSLIEKAASKTKSEIDDKIIHAIKLPIRYLAIILGLFYATRDFSWAFSIKDKEFGVADIMFVLLALLVGFTLSRVLKTVFVWYGNRDETDMSQTMFVFVRKIISVVVYSIVLLVVFSQLGVQIGPLLAGLGVAGLAIALGLQSTMENLFAALFLVLDKSISIGDWIQLDDGTKAYIEDISWRSVRIRTRDGNTVIVPNSVFVGQKIASYDYPEKSFRTSVTVGVSYSADLEKAEYIALQAAEKVIEKEGIKDRENNPVVRYRNFADSSIELSVIIVVDEALQEGRVKHALVKEIHQRFKENNIEIPFPQRVVEIKREA